MHFYLGLALESSGRTSEATESFRTAVGMAPAETEAMPALAHALARAGQFEEAEALVARLRAASQEKFISPFFFAVAALGFERYDEALDALEQAVEMRAMRLSELHLDRRFAPLQDDARFQRVVRSVTANLTP